MKKLLIVVPDTTVGGITTAAYNLANVLTEKGHLVYFLDMSGLYHNADSLNTAVNRLFLVGKSRFWSITAGESNGLSKLSHLLLGVVKKLTIRSGLWYRLIFSKFDSDVDYDTALAFRQCEPCYSFVIHNVKAKKKVGFIHGEKKYMGDISSWDKYFKDFDGVACVSEYVRSEFSEAYPKLSDKFCCVYNTFDIRKINEKAEEEKDIEFDKQKVNFVTVSRIDNAFKRLQFVPETCKILLEKGITDFCWYVIGDGPDFDKTREYVDKLGVKDFAVFAGRRDNPFPYVKCADLFILCSVSEAYAMVVKEAHILGIPALSTEYCAIHEVISENTDGFIVEGTPKALADKIEWLLADGRKELLKIKNSAKQKQVTNELAYRQLISIME